METSDPSRRRHELDCLSPAWNQGLHDGWEGKSAAQPEDGDYDTPYWYNYVDGYVTGGAEREGGQLLSWHQEASGEGEV